MKNSGFTLLELMTVIAIVGVLGSITIVNYLGWLQKQKVSSAVRSVHNTFQLARVAAVNKNSTVSLVFSPGSNSFYAFLDNGDGGGTPADGLLNGTEMLVKKTDLPAGVDLKNPSFGTMLQFNNRGMPNAGGDVSMENQSISKTVRLMLSGKSSIL